ncbi:hypothetical protein YASMINEVIRUS_1507 [Yasminevirus sp. GU-2018]|uniref:LicD/FKTN/FKRP nucleotidyltransferase domain-containing protein n=1 Tax=Yasminevirus sp. GU-2018 TaxID=2420051 RepID=A0A5K0UB81_9VIRU|nr:hypothetical protein YASMINEVIRUS_1507 [Yasminevirus sp. GU-2018]
MFGNNTGITLVVMIALISVIMLVHTHYCGDSYDSYQENDCSNEGFKEDQQKTHPDIHAKKSGVSLPMHGSNSVNSVQRVHTVHHIRHPVVHHQVRPIVRKPVRIPRRFKYIKPNIVTQLYKLMYILDSVLTRRNIEVWMSDGTFLGAVRHSGIIPWDDDGDFQIWDSDRTKLEQLRSVFEMYGIVLMDTWFGYKLFFKNASPIKGYRWLYPAIDIFPVKLNTDNELEFSYPKAQRAFGKCRFDYSKLYPLKRYAFGSFTLNGPSEEAIKPYFDRCYGDDWSTHAYQTFDHENEKMIKNKVKIVLTPDDKEPAKPIHFNKPVIY